jgi:endonuclease/exonuclease/phosphatase family metal-dependent hydrolase
VRAPTIDPVTDPTPADGDFALVCQHYKVSDEERRLMTAAFLRDPPSAVRAFRAVARAIWCGDLA